MRYILFLFLFAAYIPAASAQKNKVKSQVTRIQPPKLFTAIQDYRDSVNLPAAVAGSLMELPFTVTDDSKKDYSISSYQFLYRKNTVTEDEESGKASASTAIYADRFKTSPLPAAWISKVQEDLKPGEQLYFFDIIVKDQQGRVMYAPDLKIVVL